MIEDGHTSSVFKIMNTGNKQVNLVDSRDAGVLLCLIIQRVCEVWSFIHRFRHIKD